MPRADPKAARDVAVKHLFRHLGDERQLLANPLVGPDILAGTLTHEELRSRIARAAVAIRDEDANAGRAERGKRQSTCLVRCDLGTESVADVAAEFAISPRQLARERHEAWLRALRHVLPAAAPTLGVSMAEIVQNRALALFRIGRARDAAAMMRERIGDSSAEDSLFGLCSLSLMQHDFGRIREAHETFGDLVNRAARSSPQTDRLKLALCLANALLETEAAVRPSSPYVRDLVRRAALEVSPWMARTILRLFFALFKKYSSAHDYAAMRAIVSEIDEMNVADANLDSHDELSLHTVRSISEWKYAGFNTEMETQTIRALHLAIANGWTDVVAESASLLATACYESGSVVSAREYRDVALSAASLTDDNESIALVYNNFAIAALDAGCVEAAVQFTSQCFPAKRATHPLLEHLPLVAAEILVKRGSVKAGMTQAKQHLQAAEAAGNQRVVATAGRVVGLALEAEGERHGALRMLKRSVDIAIAGYCSKFDTLRIRSTYDRVAGVVGAAAVASPRRLRYQDFF